MISISIIGKKGSSARREITKGCGIKLFTGQKTDAIINYGVSGESLSSFFKKHPIAKSIMILNREVGQSKYNTVLRAKECGIIIPESKLSLDKDDVLSEWIEKRAHSSQGYGIKEATKRTAIAGKYYQKMINNRRYELRVHSFLWLPKDKWTVNKRIGPQEQIAWNFHQGGHFRSINNHNAGLFLKAKDISEEVLKMLKMAFGAVDFIVDSESNLLFLEVNSSPGFTDFNKAVYMEAMNELKTLSVEEVNKLCFGGNKCLSSQIRSILSSTKRKLTGTRKG